MFGSYAGGAWTMMNTMTGPLAGENNINHVVGQNLDFDQRMQMLAAYCGQHPGETFYDAIRGVRRNIVNKQ